jgi:poly(A) polymerase Pap1
MAAPIDAELKANDTLIAELKRQNNFETTDETDRR